MDGLCLKVGISGLAAAPPIPVSGSSCLESRVAASVNPSSSQMSVRSSSTSATASIGTGRNWGFSFRFPPVRSLWPNGGGGAGGKGCYDAALAVEEAAVLVEEEEKEEGGDDYQKGNKGKNSIFSIWNVRIGGGGEVLEEEKDAKEKEDDNDGSNEQKTEASCGVRDGCDGCAVNYNDDEQKTEASCGVRDGCDGCAVNCNDDEKISFDKESFSKLLKRVSLAEARLYAQMSDLGNLAYSVPQIKPGNLLKNFRLQFVTSSVEKREQRIKADGEKASSAESQNVKQDELTYDAKLTDEDVAGKGVEHDHISIEEEKGRAGRISAAAAYQIAASAASYLHSRTMSIFPFKNQSATQDIPKSTTGSTDEVAASMMASPDSVTAVVAAKEEVKQAVADDLNSVLSSPCEWFICDDDQNATRFFVIQGSESMSSWQANLLFEPVKFEGFDVLVHRGIYEAAKGIYEQMLPEVRSHLKSHGKRASLRFTGHSLGGSLSLLINLMLLIREEVPSSSLLPVITFGAPTVMCGGDTLLEKLGLPRSHVRAITMHRDIVPRAFSCNYPNHVAEFLKAVNGNFRSLPCLTNQKLLYAPMGEFLILQPDETFSPSHDLLPAGSGLYLMTCSAGDAEKQIQAAKAVFLNSPHPLDILSDRAAYGSGGTIQRDHDMGSYLKSVRNVIEEEEERMKTEQQNQYRDWWRLVAASSSGLINPGVIHSVAGESLKKISKLVVSQRLHLVVVFFFPARLLILGALSALSFH